MVQSLTVPQRTRNRRAALVGISLGYFMVLLDTTVLAVAEPDLISSLHTDVIGVGWATTSYTIALASALVLAGRVADTVGADRMFVGGVIGFGIGSLVCAISPGVTTLLLTRVLLGLFAAAIIPSSVALLAALHPEPAERTVAVGVWASISGAAMAAGPVLGGWLVDLAGWRAVFVINAPIAVVVIVLCGNAVPVPRSARRIALAPHLGLVLTLATLTLAITEAGRRSWATCLGAIVAAFVLAGLTARADRRSPAPIVPDSLRGNRDVWSALGWGGIVNYSLSSVLFVIPLALHEGAAETGLTLLPMTLLVALNPLATSRLVARYGPLRPIRMGLLAFTIGLCAAGMALADGHHTVILGAALIACGLGVSWTLPPLIGHILGRTPSDATGSVGGILNATRQVGATLGAATASAALAAHPDGVRVATPLVGAAVLCALGLAGSMMTGRRAEG